MRIKELREENGFSQTTVATAIGGSQSNLAKWEKGQVQPTADAIIKLADFFNVSADFLLGRSDDLGNIFVPSPTVPTLTDDEKQLLDMFERMSHQMKIRALAYCEGLLSADPKRASKD